MGQSFIYVLSYLPPKDNTAKESVSVNLKEHLATRKLIIGVVRSIFAVSFIEAASVHSLKFDPQVRSRSQH